MGYVLVFDQVDNMGSEAVATVVDGCISSITIFDGDRIGLCKRYARLKRPDNPMDDTQWYLYPQKSIEHATRFDTESEARKAAHDLLLEYSTTLKGGIRIEGQP